MSADTAARDFERIDAQVAALWFDSFDEQAAWELGRDLRERALARGVAVTVEVRLHGATVFLHAMPGTAPANADWARRKRNVVEVLHRPSYAVGREELRDGRSILHLMALDPRDHAAHGGAFPLMVRGTGCVGVVTVSGLPQRADHDLVVEAVAARCGVPLDEIALAAD